MSFEDVAVLEELELEKISVSVSLPESSSQESATGLDLGFAWILEGDFLESVRWERVSATSVELVSNLIACEKWLGKMYRLPKAFCETL